MKVLLVGSGAREHALAWKLSISPHLTRLFLLPGNPGMRPLGDTVTGVSPLDPEAVAAVAVERGADLVVIGPEAPLAAGVVDALHRTGVPVFGPTAAGARLESSKAFAKDVMERAGVPTAAARVFSDPMAAKAHVTAADGPYVVKADGLAAGKGVLVTGTRSEAMAWIDHCFDGGFGAAGSRVVVEQHLDGPELSVFAICDGRSFVTLEPARDYKRLADGDLGPNTGGMGSYAPVRLDPDLVPTVVDSVLGPTLELMAADGTPYVGFLYAGLALTAEGPKVIEFNCRLGDPETQVVLPRLDSDLLPILAAAARGRLDTAQLQWLPTATVNVVLAAPGYPTAPVTGDPIEGLEHVPENVRVFHAGTAVRDDRIVTAGGRVLSVVGSGPDLPSARRAAYEAAEGITFPGRQMRRDIAAA